MQEPLDLEQLRRLFLNAPESETTRLVAITLSLSLLCLVLVLVRRRTLREEYTPVWLGLAVMITIVSLRLDWLRALTRVIGAWTPSSTLFFLGFIFLLLISLNYAVRLSKVSGQVKRLAQESAVQRARIEQLLEAGGGDTAEPTQPEGEAPECER